MGMSRREFHLLMTSAAAALAAPRALSAPLKVRREINTLSAADLDVYRAGVQAMKDLPTLDFRSWMYQAGVHGSPPAEAIGIPDASTYWRQCQHGSSQFLSWHRWYTLFFEEIVRNLADDCHFTLPYWDCIADNKLPLAVRQPANTTDNALYDPTRWLELNTGIDGVFSLNTDFMDVIDFEEFADDISSNPHSTVHLAVDGNMRVVNTAARDPLFWLHHCNIDRYWECWVRKGNGRVNPGAPWTDQTFPFHTLTGRREVIVGDGMRTADLGYTYDNLPCSDFGIVWQLPDWVRELVFERPAWRKPPIPDPPPWRAILELDDVTFGGTPKPLVLRRDQFLAAGGANANRVAISLHDVEIPRNESTRASMVEVALVPDVKRAQARDLSGVKLIRSFGAFEVSVAQAHVEHHGMANVITLELPSKARKALASAGEEFALLFYRRGVVQREGKALPWDPKLPVAYAKSVRISVQ